MIEMHQPISPVETAEELSDALSNVGYHFRVLERDGAIRLVGTAPVLGAVKHYYVPGRLFHRYRQLVLDVLAADES